MNLPRVSRALIVFLVTGTIAPLSAQVPPETNPVVERVVSSIEPSRIHATIEKLAGFGTRHTLSDTSSATRGIGAARRWIRSEFERIASAAGGRMTVRDQLFIAPPSPRIPHPTPIVNVIATLRPEGASPDAAGRIFVVSAHYDSRASEALDSTGDAPGADDDGSGIAVVLELARVISTLHPNATVVFAAFAGEEQGLYGSTFFAQEAVKEGMHIEGVFNNDIVGNTHGGDGGIDSTSVRLFSEAYSPADTGRSFRTKNSLGYENDGASRTLARYIADAGAQYVPGFQIEMVYRRDRFLRGGDQSPFHDRGFAAVRFSEMKENFDRQHQNVRTANGKSFGDVPEWVDGRYCAQIARVNAAALASLCIAPPPPEHAAILTRGLEYSTELEWRRPVFPPVAGYYVRYRRTSMPLWEGRAFTPDTALTLQISKDDHIFGIQSVDRDGNASLEVLPLPLR